MQWSSTCLRFSSDSSQLTMSSATLLPTAILSCAVTSKTGVTDALTISQERVPTPLTFTEQLTALQSHTNPATGGHLTSKGGYCLRDFHCMPLKPFTTESAAFCARRPVVVNTPCDLLGGPPSPFARTCFPPSLPIVA